MSTWKTLAKVAAAAILATGIAAGVAAPSDASGHKTTTHGNTGAVVRPLDTGWGNF